MKVERTYHLNRERREGSEWLAFTGNRSKNGEK